MSDSQSFIHCSENNIMGNSSSTPNKSPGPGAKIGSKGPIHRTRHFRPPMPSEEEVERKFMEVLLKMDLPAEKAMLLKSFDIGKKWDMIIDQVRRIELNVIRVIYKAHDIFYFISKIVVKNVFWL